MAVIAEHDQHRSVRIPHRAGSAGRAQAAAPTVRRTCVLDTSVLLADPDAYLRFGAADVVIPVVVVTELEAHRGDVETGWAARRALHGLERLRQRHGRLDMPVAVGAGTVTVDLSADDETVLPQGLRLHDNDTRLLALARRLADGGREVVVVSRDLPLRIKAAAVGLDADDAPPQAAEREWTGVCRVDVDADEIADLYEAEIGVSEAARGLPVNTGLVVQSPRGSALARVTGDGEYRLVHGDRELFGLRGRSAEQRLAIDLLQDPSVGIVSLGGRAGTGKSALALCAGLDAVLEHRRHQRIVVFRPLYAVGGQELGYLPGDQQDKMGPWGQAVFDTLGSVVSENVVEEVLARGILEVLPLTHIRGRSLHDAFVIVDEAQSLERGVLLTMLSRIGQNSRVVLTHDVAQRDNRGVGRYDGIASVVSALTGHGLFGHITLTRSERSEIAALVTDVLADGE